MSRISKLDRYLPVWILAAMAIGLTLGRLIPGLGRALESIQVAGISLPIAVGLLVMMYPVLAPEALLRFCLSPSLYSFSGL